MTGPAYRPLDSSVFGEGKKWINLGFWASRDGRSESYELACEKMASIVGDAAGIGQEMSVLDLGCGNGESLKFWRDKFGCLGRIVGVNSTKTECEVARKECARDDMTQVIEMDAVEYVKEKHRLEFDAIVSVDAVYHFNSRRIFLKRLCEHGSKGTKFAAVDIMGSKDLWNGINEPTTLKLCLSHPFRMFGLFVISSAAGVPLENLLYSSKVLQTFCINREVETMNVTEFVLRPFARHMFSKSIKTLRCGCIGQSASILASSIFIGLLGKSGLVEVALISFQV